MADENGQVPTERVVLRLEDGDCWKEIGRAHRSDKATAIKQVAGNKPGKYRAPSLRSWKGGLEIVLPTTPKLEQKAFD